VVYCDGLENRCAGNRTGGSNPSPSAKKGRKKERMKDYLPMMIVIALAMIAFIVLLRKGAFLRLSNFWNETWEELKKCTWPTWDELMGSTVVVVVAVALLGGFTVLVDFIITNIIRLIV
jgi:preprotein translocase subunit SecE